MNENFDEILNKAVEQLDQGKSQAEILSKWPLHSKELSPLLQIANLLKTLPKKAVPEPAMQRKYVFAPAKSLFLHWIRFSRLAVVGASVFIFIIAGVSAGFAASSSRPGDTFFSLKKAAEHAQLQLASSPQEKINLQIAIAQKRIDDVQAALENSQNDPEKQVAALNELGAETQNTINALNKANETETHAINQDHPLIASLQTITSKQQALLKKLETNKDSSVDKTVLSAAKENATKLAVIDEYLGAASNDQALAALNSNPSAVVISGKITQLTYNTLTVNGQIYTFTKATLIKNDEDAVINSRDLKINQNVTILGDKTDTGFLLRQVSLAAQTNLDGEVKGTSVAVSSTSTVATDKKPSASSTLESSSPQTLIILPDPNAAVGGLIIEDPTPQCPNNSCGN